MECKGQITQILGTDKNHINVLLSLTDANTEGLQELTGVELTVNLKKFHPKRSLDANAYCFAIISQMAKKLDTSTEEMYNTLITRYGVPYEDEEGKHVIIGLKNEIDINKLEGHWVWVRTRENTSFYMMLKGTSDYDSAEMAHFIDMVCEEAKPMGIDTLPRTELERMMDEWNRFYSKKKNATSAEPQST